MQMQFLVDGRASLAPSFAASAERALPGDIERIEVVRGSNSAAYGSNAFLGIVNIITDDASRQPGTRLKLSAGQPGIRDASLRHASQSGPLSLRVSAHHEQDDGFADLHDGRRTDVLNLRADLRLDGGDEVVINAGIAESTHELGYAGSIFDMRCAAQWERYQPILAPVVAPWPRGRRDTGLGLVEPAESRGSLALRFRDKQRSPVESLPRTPARHRQATVPPSSSTTWSSSGASASTRVPA